MATYRRDQTEKEKAKSRLGRRSKNKGRRWEQDIAKMLREILPPRFSVRRYMQSERRHGNPDVGVRDNGHPVLHIEAKHRAKCNWREALEQAQVDNDTQALTVAICKDDRQAPVVIMPLDEWLQLVAEAKNREES